MRYTKPEIHNESKAIPLITSTGQPKKTPVNEIGSTLFSDPSAYEADE